MRRLRGVMLEGEDIEGGLFWPSEKIEGGGAFWSSEEIYGGNFGR